MPLNIARTMHGTGMAADRHMSAMATSHAGACNHITICLIFNFAEKRAVTPVAAAVVYIHMTQPILHFVHVNSYRADTYSVFSIICAGITKCRRLPCMRINPAYPIRDGWLALKFMKLFNPNCIAD
jgi:hypothetical protein